MRHSPGYRTSATLMGALLLAGCGSLLGGGKRDDLFRFGVIERTNDTAPQAAVARRPLSLLRLRFAPEIEGDRILTTRGAQALYIKDARWVASVPDLFTQALTRQFGARAPDLRLASPRSATGASQALQVTIDRFEARYTPEADGKTPPTVVIAGEVTLFGADDRQPVASRRFSVEEPALANSTSGIVPAFDRAVTRYAAQLVDWTAQTSRSASSNPPSGNGQKDE
ncbi:ABC-type transport auxiliary lipoprotein family protein [Sphingomonas sp. HH69]